MAKMTNCEISYERNVKLAEYESKKFAARFSVLVEDGDDEEDIAELYGRQIVRFVEDKLGIRSEISVPPRVSKAAPNTALSAPKAESSPAAVETAPAIQPAVGEAPVEKKKPGRPPAAKKAAEAAKPEATQAATSDDFPEEATAPEITDAVLREQIQKHVAQHRNPVEVKKLVQTFFPAQANKVWSSTELPQAKRQAFLDKMAELATGSAADI